MEQSRLAPEPRSVANIYVKMLARGPRIPESLQLSLPDRDDMWRVRLPISDWRMIFRVDEVSREIEIVRIRRRSREDVYEGYEQS